MIGARALNLQGGVMDAEAVLRGRINRYWQPYHAKLAEELKHIRDRHGYALLFAVLGFAPVQGCLPTSDQPICQAGRDLPCLASAIALVESGAKLPFTDAVPGRAAV